jgi:hypothetical protein
MPPLEMQSRVLNLEEEVSNLAHLQDKTSSESNLNAASAGVHEVQNKNKKEQSLNAVFNGKSKMPPAPRSVSLSYIAQHGNMFINTCLSD